MPSDATCIPMLPLGGGLEASCKADPASVKLYNDLNSSVVGIETAHGTGSGFAVDKPGLILTDYHCISGETEVFVRSAENKRYRARIKSIDDIRDLALLEIEGKAPESLKPLSLGDDKALRPEQQINAIGHPGVPENYLSTGNFVERSNNYTRYSEEQKKLFASLSCFDPSDKQAFLQNDLLYANIHIRHGYSGGPVVDNSGKVVGVSVYGEESPREIGYFTPVSNIKALLDEPPKFTFNYEYQLSDGTAKEYLQSWHDHPFLTTGLSSGLAAGTAYLGTNWLSKLGWKSTSVTGAVALYGGLRLLDDIPSIQTATNDRDFLKAGLNTFADSSLLAGGLARSCFGTAARLAPEVSTGLLHVAENKLSTTLGTALLGASENGLLKTAVSGAAERYLSSAGKAGLILIAAGITIRVLSDLIPNRLVNVSIKRNDGSSRPPFDLKGY